MFNEKFPGGFTPRFGGTVRDWSGAVGIRGDISDWHYDLSAVFGQHSTEFFMKQTINPQLASLRTNIPTNYKPGAYTERDRVINLDLARSLPTTMLPSPLNIGLGLEYRIEEFETTAGEENSYYIDRKFNADEEDVGLGAQGFGIGSNGFVGFPPRIAKKNNRGSYAAYVDLETNVTKDLLVGAAGRYEEFETFGDTLNGKLECPLASHVRRGASRFDQHGLPCPDRGTGEHSERDHGDRRRGNSLTNSISRRPLW